AARPLGFRAERQTHLRPLVDVNRDVRRPVGGDMALHWFDDVCHPVHDATLHGDSLIVAAGASPGNCRTGVPRALDAAPARMGCTAPRPAAPRRELSSHANG